MLYREKPLLRIRKQSRSGRPIQNVSPSIMLLMSTAPTDLERPCSLNCAIINGYSYGHLWIPRTFRRLRNPVREKIIGINWRNSPKNIYQKESYNRAILESPLTGDFLQVVRWTDPDTAVFWAFSSDAGKGALFDLKVDSGGNWKLMKAKVLSGKEAEKQQDPDS